MERQNGGREESEDLTWSDLVGKFGVIIGRVSEAVGRFGKHGMGWGRRGWGGGVAGLITARHSNGACKSNAVQSKYVLSADVVTLATARCIVKSFDQLIN